MTPARRPVGEITRGTTNPNRLRRVDRWLAGTQAWRLRGSPSPPVVVDLGYGASPVTVVELAQRLAAVHPEVEVVGIEIDPERVAAAQPLTRPGLSFTRGGFEVPLPGARRPVLVRAFNVLRQYPEQAVAQAWATIQARLEPDGLLVEGTCDELGRLATWVAVEAGGPVSLTLSWRLAGLEHPSVIAERLPKALIHRNLPSERIHDVLAHLDDAWERAAPFTAYGMRQRFRAMADQVVAEGLDLGPRQRWRLGEVTLPWAQVAPR